MSEMMTELGTAGAIIAATIILLREIRKSTPKVAKRDTVRPPSANGRVQALEDRTQGKMNRLEDKMQSQGEQLDCLRKEQCETTAVVERLNVQQERQSGKLDTILEIVRRRRE